MALRPHHRWKSKNPGQCKLRPLLLLFNACVTLILLCIYSAPLLWLQVIHWFPWAIQQVFPSHLVARLQVQVSKLYKGLSQVHVDYSVLSPPIASLCARIGVALCQPCEPPIRQEPASQDLSLRLSRHCGWYTHWKFRQFASRWLAAKKRLEKTDLFIPPPPATYLHFVS